jgi:aminoglycoside 2'-N-acetyltransferase I
MMAEPNVSAARTEDLAADTRAAIIAVCLAAHQQDDFRQLFTYVPAGGLHFLGYAGHELVSHALVTTRWLQPGDGPLLKTAYVDAVATLPAYQGQGHGSAVMRRLAGAIAAEYEVACLETDRPGFYARLGWEAWRGPLAGRGADGLVPTPAQTGIMLLRWARTPPLDLDGPLSIEIQSGRIW